MARRIMVVDDDDSIRELVSLTLDDEGYEVITAEHGSAALALLHQQAAIHPDLILLDMRMPVMDGWEFTLAYRRSFDHQASIIVVTAAQDAAQFAAQVQSDGFLAKPFDLDDLLNIVQSHLR